MLPYIAYMDPMGDDLIPCSYYLEQTHISCWSKPLKPSQGIVQHIKKIYINTN